MSSRRRAKNSQKNPKNNHVDIYEWDLEKSKGKIPFPRISSGVDKKEDTSSETEQSYEQKLSSKHTLKSSCTDRKHHRKERNTDCKETVNISQKDINRASKHHKRGYLIDEPGTYVLCEDVRWKNKFDDAFAITISSDNVTLDLNNFMIRQNNTNLANGAAVKVSENIMSVTIKNGKLSEFSGAGVIVYGGASCVHIEDIMLTDSLYRGGYVANLGPVAGEVKLNPGIFVFGAGDNRTKHITIKNCEFCDNGRLGDVFESFSGIFAIEVLYADNIIIEDIEVKGIFGSLFTSAISASFVNYMHVSRIDFTDLVSNNITFGIVHLGTLNTIMEDINGTDLKLKLENPNFNTRRGAEGLKYSGSSNMTVRRTNISGISVTGSSSVNTGDYTIAAAGLLITVEAGDVEENGIFEDINIVNVFSTGGETVDSEYNSFTAGVALDGATNLKFKNVVVSRVSATAGYVYGFGSRPSSILNVTNEGITFENCSASYISGNLKQVSPSLRTNAVYAAGFVLDGNLCQMIDCQSSNIGDFVPLDTVRPGNYDYPRAYGLLFDTRQHEQVPPVSGEATQCIATNTRITYAEGYAVYDVTESKTSVFTGTYAMYNGFKETPENSSFVGVAPIYLDRTLTRQLWNLPSGPFDPVPSVGAKLANLDAHEFA